jgi:hypothetical protein
LTAATAKAAVAAAEQQEVRKIVEMVIYFQLQ